VAGTYFIAVSGMNRSRWMGYSFGVLTAQLGDQPDLYPQRSGGAAFISGA
jgi:hypothetical protein